MFNNRFLSLYSHNYTTTATAITTTAIAALSDPSPGSTIFHSLSFGPTRGRERDVIIFFPGTEGKKKESSIGRGGGEEEEFRGGGHSRH